MYVEINKKSTFEVNDVLERVKNEGNEVVKYLELHLKDNGSLEESLNTFQNINQIRYVNFPNDKYSIIDFHLYTHFMEIKRIIHEECSEVVVYLKR